MRAGLYGIALVFTHVIAWVRAEYALSHAWVLVGAKHGAGEAAALHLRQLVYEHIACRSDFALKTQAAA